MGFHNYRDFFFFVIFSFVGCAYVTATASLFLFFPSSSASLYVADTPSSVVATFVFAVALAISLGCLSMYHLFLVCFGMTTLEFMKRIRVRAATGEWQNPFDLGWRRNLVSVLGTPGFLCIHWLNPFIGKGRPGDGITWKNARPTLLEEF